VWFGGWGGWGGWGESGIEKKDLQKENERSESDPAHQRGSARMAERRKTPKNRSLRAPPRGSKEENLGSRQCEPVQVLKAGKKKKKSAQNLNAQKGTVPKLKRKRSEGGETSMPDASKCRGG